MLDRRKVGFEECPLMVGHLSSRCDSVCLKPWGMGYAHFMAIKEEGTWGIEPPDLATWLFSHLYRRTCDAGASRQITPGYVFSFFLLGDCASRISWDFFHAAGARDLNRQWRCSSFVEETSPGNLPLRYQMVSTNQAPNVTTPSVVADWDRAQFCLRWGFQVSLFLPPGGWWVIYWGVFWGTFSVAKWG